MKGLCEIAYSDERVELTEGSLFSHYSNDRGRTLLERLTYSKEDSDRGLEPAHSITFMGSKGYQSIYEGTVSLRNAVMYYFDFIKQQN